jgi:holo-[acyl-carrier protein] synthase
VKATALVVGTDLVEIARLRAAMEAQAPRLAERLFTEGEQSYCRSQGNPWASFAARFAAKEAVRKIYGQWGFHDVIWRETEVASDAGGAPHLRLHGTARERAEGFCFTLSLAHTEELAQAVCIAYREE